MHLFEYSLAIVQKIDCREVKVMMKQQRFAGRYAINFQFRFAISAFLRNFAPLFSINTESVFRNRNDNDKLRWMRHCFAQSVQSRCTKCAG